MSDGLKRLHVIYAVLATRCMAYNVPKRDNAERNSEKPSRQVTHGVTPPSGDQRKNAATQEEWFNPST